MKLPCKAAAIGKVHVPLLFAAALALFRGYQTGACTDAEQQQVQGLGVDHYPTLLAVTERGLIEVGSPTASAAEIKAAL